MAILEVELGTELVEGLKSLAVRRYGGDEDSAMGRLVELALVMRLFWHDLMEEGRGEVEEPVLEWGSDNHQAGGHAADQVREWLFGKE